MVGVTAFAQNRIQSNQPLFDIEGEVIDKETDRPISRVNVEILGGAYTTTDGMGRFSVRGAVGQELIIRSTDFETVYRTITNEDFIRVEVINSQEEYPFISKVTSRSYNDFSIYLDSAKATTKTDATKSINYITEAINSIPGGVPSALQNKMAF